MLVLIKVNVLNYKTLKIHKYVQVFVAENLSFHNVRLLGHNGTSKPVKVPILSLALLAAVAGKLTARTTFKVLSFFGWLLYKSSKKKTGHFQSFFIIFFRPPPPPPLTLYLKKKSRKSTNKKNLASATIDL